MRAVIELLVLIAADIFTIYRRDYLVYWSGIIISCVCTTLSVVFQVGASTKKSTPRAKVIVCRDNSVQTGLYMVKCRHKNKATNISSEVLCS